MNKRFFTIGLSLRTFMVRKNDCFLRIYGSKNHFAGNYFANHKI